MKKRRNKKRIIIAAVIVYLAVIGIVAVWESGRQKPANPDTAAAQEEAYNRKKAVIDAQEKAEQQAYDKAVQLLDYDVDRLITQETVTLDSQLQQKAICFVHQKVFRY